MIVTRQMSNIKCDCCGQLYDDECWVDVEDAHTLLNEALGNYWIKHNGKHYCPDCYSYDDEDNLVIDKSRKVCL